MIFECCIFNRKVGDKRVISCCAVNSFPRLEQVNRIELMVGRWLRRNFKPQLYRVGLTR